MVTNQSSLRQFQELNRNIYGIVNDQSYGTSELLFCLQRHITQVLKAVRKGKPADIPYRLCMALSYSLALCNRFHIDLAENMWECFPGYCPYCGGTPCNCKERAEARLPMTILSHPSSKPLALYEWQAMFGRIYQNPVQDSAMHLAEEAGEVAEAMRSYAATHSAPWFQKIVEELVDLVTNLFGVANGLKLDLASLMVCYFANGCPKCCRMLCGCDYITVDKPVLR